ncbi:MAG TPA: ATP-binding protein [Acidimicrobiales bacterium]|jgi:anti-sigma regulatory factor (Ser/Thr protein kinase)|nr:ATP-binding protein [Acidimicrobiales bacterium]
MTKIGVPGLRPATFDPVLASIPLARNFVLEGLGKAAVDREVALLLTSELVTNAIRHAGTRFEVEVSPAGDDRVCISVTDASPVVPQPLAAPPEAQSGRGLFFVEQYAADWGVEITSAGKRVWFVLPCRD